MSLTIPSNFMFHSSHLQNQQLLKTQFEFRIIQANATRKNPKRVAVFSRTDNYRNHHMFSSYKPFSVREVFTRASNDKEIDALRGSSTSLGDGYVSLFIKMLGLNNDPLDREQAVVALWKYSLGGKQYVDGIMQFHGCINLIINLLNSESFSACEAAAGLLCTISSVNAYTHLVVESGAIEEITGLLNQSSLNSEVRVQCLFTLWNLSVDEQHRGKIGNSDLLPLLIKSLDDEDIKVIEAAGGVLANLSLTHSSHSLMVEAGVIPKLANLLMHNEGSKVIKKEAKNVLLELAKDDYYKILVLEEGLVLVPLIGGAAYKSFRPDLHSWPSLPDGTEIEQSSKGPSRFGASELLLGLNVEEKNAKIEEVKMNAIVGRTHQHFLARIGAIEMEDDKEAQGLSRSKGFTLLPWRDGVARLVLILQLVDESAITRAADSIADASINEHMRISFKEAGAVRQLVRLLDHQNEAVRLAVTHALERLSVSNDVCHVMKAEGALHPLLSCLKKLEISENLMEKTLDVITRILDPSKEMKLKFYDGPVNGSKNRLDATRNLSGTTGLTENMGEMIMPESYTRKDELDCAVVARLVEIMRTASPNLQRKAASILEFVMILDPSMDKLMSTDIESGLDAVFQLKLFKDVDSEMMDDEQQPETALEIEEAGLAVSAASRLLTKLLDSEQFRLTINPLHLTKLLRRALKSDISLPNKNWVAASLVKLSSYISAPNPDLKNPINMEVTLYESIPRLIEQIKSSFSPEVKEAAVMELNRIVSEGVVDSSRAVAAEGGIFSSVKLIEESIGCGREVDAGLAILYNLSMDSENHSAMLAAGIVPVLRKIVLAERPQWKQALHLLRTLPT